MDVSRIESDIEHIVTGIYTSPEMPHYPYHNLAHTIAVVTHVDEMVAAYHLEQTDSFILNIAAWFHDIGHLYGDMTGHEERGITIMMDYLQTVPRDLTVAIAQCILATKVPGHPNNLLEKIICDADTYHFGTPLFRETDDKVRRELLSRTGMKLPDWPKKSLLLLQQHVFFTDYCRNLLKKGKIENIAWLVGQIE
jgi:predicted metal-dependent HD superfamily phosphohydrolase